MVMTKQELATLVSAIVAVAEENNTTEEMKRPACPYAQQRGITITDDKNKGLLYLLLQYRNLNATKASVPTFAQPTIQAGQPISWGG